MSINLALPQVTRIPISGPEPYNTLVCVQTTSDGGGQLLQSGTITRYPLTVPTKFRLAGFDQRVIPVFEHSTTAFLSSIGPEKDDTWLYAVDEVTGAGFDQADGSYFVNVNMAAMAGEGVGSQCSGGICYYGVTVQVVSYVLCYEPPLPAPSRFPGASAVYVNKVPPRRSANILEQAAIQFGRPYTLKR